MKKAVSVLAVAGLAGAAFAGGYDWQFVYNGGPLTESNPTATIEVWAGTFGVGGFGPNKWFGSLSTDADGSIAIGATNGPTPPELDDGWANGPSGPFGDGTNDVTVIDRFRGPVPDFAGTNPPDDFGVDSFVLVYSFNVTATDFLTDDHITVSGTGEGTSITAWNWVSFQFAWFPNAPGAPQSVTHSIDIPVVQVPAPGAAALLGLGGLLAARRRR